MSAFGAKRTSASAFDFASQRRSVKITPRFPRVGIAETEVETSSKQALGGGALLRQSPGGREAGEALKITRHMW